MRPIDKVREQIPELQNQPDGTVVDLFSRATNLSPQAVSLELGLDPNKYTPNEGVIGDIGTDLKLGVTGLPRTIAGIADFVNPATYTNNPEYTLSNFVEEQYYEPTGVGDYEDYLRRFEYSPELREQKRAQAEAREEGLGSFAKSLVANPRATLSGITQSVPDIALGGGIGKGVQLAARGARGASAVSGAAASQGGSRLAQLGPAAREAAERTAPYIGEASVIAGQQMQSLIDEGVEPREAAQIAFSTGAGSGLVARGVGNVGARAGFGDPEQIIVGRREFSPDVPERNILTRIPGTAAVEGTQEAIQSPIEQIGRNIGTDQPLFENVPEASLQGLASGTAFGAPFGVLPQRRQERPRQEGEPLDILLEQREADTRAEAEADLEQRRQEMRDQVRPGQGATTADIINQQVGLGQTTQRTQEELDEAFLGTSTEPSGIRVTDPTTQREIELTEGELNEYSLTGQIPRTVYARSQTPYEIQNTQAAASRVAPASESNTVNLINRGLGVNDQPTDADLQAREQEVTQRLDEAYNTPSGVRVIDPATQQERELTEGELYDLRQMGRMPVADDTPTAPSAGTAQSVEPAQSDLSGDLEGEVELGDITPDDVVPAEPEFVPDDVDAIFKPVMKSRPKTRRTTVKKQVEELRESVPTSSLNPETEQERAQLAQAVEDWGSTGSSDVRPLVADAFLDRNDLKKYLDQPEQVAFELEGQTEQTTRTRKRPLSDEMRERLKAIESMPSFSERTGMRLPDPRSLDGIVSGNRSRQPQSEVDNEAEQRSTEPEPDTEQPQFNTSEDVTQAVSEGLEAAIDASNVRSRVRRKADPENPEAEAQILEFIKDYVVERRTQTESQRGLDRAKGEGFREAAETNLAPLVKDGKVTGQWLSRQVQDVENELRDNPSLQAANEYLSAQFDTAQSDIEADTQTTVNDADPEPNLEAQTNEDGEADIGEPAADTTDSSVEDMGFASEASDENLAGLQESKDPGGGESTTRVSNRAAQEWAKLAGLDQDDLSAATAEIRSLPEESFLVWDSAVSAGIEAGADAETMRTMLTQLYDNLRGEVGTRSTDQSGGELQDVETDQLTANQQRIEQNNQAGRELYERLQSQVPEAPAWEDLKPGERDAFVEAAGYLEGSNESSRLRSERQAVQALRSQYGQESTRARGRRDSENPTGGFSRGGEGNNPSQGRASQGQVGRSGNVRRDTRGSRTDAEGQEGSGTADGTTQENASGQSSPQARVKRRGGKLNRRDSRADRRNYDPDAPSTAARIQAVIDRYFGNALAANTGFNPTVFENTDEAVAYFENSWAEEVANGDMQSARETSQTLKDLKAGTMAAFVQTYEDGSSEVFFVADAIPVHAEESVVMHEIGSHVGLDNVMDAPTREDTVSDIEALANSDGDTLDARLARYATRTVEDNYDVADRESNPESQATYESEVLAHFIDAVVALGGEPYAAPLTAGRESLRGEKTPVQKIMDKIINAFRAFIARLRSEQVDRAETAQSILDMAYGAAVRQIGGQTPEPSLETGVHVDDLVGNRVPGMAARARKDSRISEAAEENIARLPNRARSGVRTIQENISNGTVADYASNASDKFGFGVLTFTRDLVEKARTDMPAAKTLFDLLFRIEARRQQDQQTAEEIVERSGELNEGQRAAVNTFLRDSTVSNRWGYQPDWRDGAVNIDPVMQRRFNSLSQEQQQTIKDINRYGDEMLARKQQVMDDWVMKSYDRRVEEARAAGNTERVTELEADRAEVLDQNRELFRSGVGPYAPLKRFGNYVVMGTSPEFEAAVKNKDYQLRDRLKRDPNHFEMSFAESIKEANEKRDNLKKRFANADRFEKMEAFKRMEGDINTFEKLRQALTNDTDQLEPKDQQRLNGLVDDLILKSLSEQHSREAQNRRRKIPGFDNDMIRSFATQARADVFWVSNLTSVSDINDTLSEFREQARYARPGDTMDLNRKRRIYNELYKRYTARSEGQDGPLQTFQNKFAMLGSVWYLLLSPGYYIQNSLQPVMMSIPWLARDYKYGDANKFMTTAYRELGGMAKGSKFFERFDFSKLPKDVREIAQELENRNAVHSTISADLGSFTSDSSNSKFQRFDAAIRELPNKLEQVNRLSTGVAAYRLARQKGNMSHEAAIDYAENAVVRTQGDYSDLNAPALFSNRSGIPSRLLFQFRKFQLIQVAYMGSMLKQAFKGASPEEKAAGLRGVGFALGHAAVGTGLKGLPAMGLFGMLASMVMGGDDEPAQLDRKARQGMHDMGMPPWLIGMVMNGVAEPAFGSTFTTKVGWANMLSVLPYTDIDFSERSSYDQVTTALLGPTLGGIGQDVFLGIGDIQNGKYYEGIQRVLPKGIADPMKTARYATSGVTDNLGDTVLPQGELGPMQLLFTSLGLPPKVLTDRWYLNSQKYEAEQFFREQSSEIRRDYEDAKKNGESTYEIQQRWRELQRSRRENGFSSQPLSVLLRNDQTEREEKTIKGIKFDSGNREFIEQTARTLGN